MSLLTMYDSDRSYLKFFDSTRAGQIVQTHIDSMEDLLRMQHRLPCPQQRASEMARVLLSTLNTNRTWLGLPNKLPRAIAFLHLSGETVLLHSDALALIYVIVCAGVHAQDLRVLIGVKSMLDFAEQHDTSLLLTLALPWQSGTNTIFWELRSLRRSAEGVLVDGEQIFTARADECQRGSSIAQAPMANTKMMREWAKAYEESVCAVCVDTSPDGDESATAATAAEAGGSGTPVVGTPVDAGSLGGSLQADTVLKTLRNSCNFMAKQRQEVMQENKELRRKHTLALRAQKEQIEKDYVEEKARHEATRAELERAQSELLEKREKWEGDNRRLNGENLEALEKLKKTEEQMAGLRDLRDAAKKAERTASQTLEHEREQQKLRIQDFVDGSERRVSELTLRLSQLGAQVSTEQQARERKDELLDGMRAEREALQFEARSATGALRCARVVLAVGKRRVETERAAAKKKLDDAAQKQVKTEKKLVATRKAAEELRTAASAAAAQRAAEVAAEATAATTTTHAASVSANAVTPAPPETAAATTRSRAEVCTNTEPLPDPPEMAHLQTILDKKHAEVDQLQKRLLEAESKAGSGGTVYGGDPSIDALLEALAIESRRVQRDLYNAQRATHATAVQQQQQHGGGVGAYEPPYAYNPMLTASAYGYYQ